MTWVRADPVDSQTWSRHNKTDGESSKLILDRDGSEPAGFGVVVEVDPVLPTGCAPNGALLGVFWRCFCAMASMIGHPQSERKGQPPPASGSPLALALARAFGLCLMDKWAFRVDIWTSPQNARLDHMPTLQRPLDHRSPAYGLTRFACQNHFFFSAWKTDSRGEPHTK
jgi:hypothetical protein